MSETSLNTILKTIGIESIVWIDDQFYEQTELSHQEQECLTEIRALISAGNFEKINNLISLIFDKTDEFDEGDPKLEIEDFFKDEINDKNIVRVVEYLGLKKDWSKSSFNTLVSDLRQHDENIKTFSWSQWSSNKDKLEVNEKTLFIVDYAFKDEPDAKGDGGDIAKSLTMTIPESSLCFVLTHEQNPGDGEVELRQQIINDKNISSECRCKFSVVSKKGIGDTNQDFSNHFAFAIQRVYLQQKNSKLFGCIRGKIRESFDQLYEDLNTASAYDIGKIVFDSTRHEGASEIDLLKRFVNIKINSAFSDALNDGSNLESINNIRNVQSIDLKPKIKQTIKDKRFFQYRDAELFDYSINSTYSPLAVGDIFKIRTDEGTKNFILVAQPCDIAVRDDGKRSANYVYLLMFDEVGSEDVDTLISNIQKKFKAENEGVVLSNNSKKQVKKILSDFMGSSINYFLPIIDRDGNAKRLKFYLNLKNIHACNVNVLECCCFNDSGHLKICSSADLESIKKSLHLPGWKKRIDNISKNKVFSFQDTLSVNWCGEPDFGIDGKRVRRLNSPYIDELVRQFFAFRARTGFEHDFL